METNKYEGNKLIATHSFTVFPQDLNYEDTLFGGTIMQHMDIAGVKVVRRALYGTGADGAVTASVDRIDFEFEIPVDEEFYNESQIGRELGEGSRSFSFGHSGDIKVIGKRIE